MIAIALVALAAPAFAASAEPSIPQVKPVQAAAAEPAFIQMPKDGGGLTLYNAKGEVVARCEQRGNTFANCKLEPGVTLDDLMNAWVRAYQDLGK
jgi:hypothetical protein